jgi:hypothetical protein
MTASADIDVRQGVEKIGIFWFLLSILSALWASGKSCHTIGLHLKNYRRPDLQRLTIRILLMYCFHSHWLFLEGGRDLK